MLLIALGIKLTSPGPVLFKQQRHGWGGRAIEVYKFRTMRLRNAPHHQVQQATRSDSRITPSCAASASTNYRNSSTCCKAACPSSALAHTPSPTTSTTKS